ncbi:hypothetical protein EYC84_011437 [Monilinia fructicola]|uniref:Uncharacterized protein n=1 Tax=Monilinia fructicola TaxID=38448 RepID=A0A5M9J610_MONFR|nr:hypothetical protein EYC84_011437 [Monilinia fructicola]
MNQTIQINQLAVQPTPASRGWEEKGGFSNSCARREDEEEEEEERRGEEKRREEAREVEIKREEGQVQYEGLLKGCGCGCGCGCNCPSPSPSPCPCPYGWLVVGCMNLDWTKSKDKNALVNSWPVKNIDNNNNTNNNNNNQKRQRDLV